MKNKELFNQMIDKLMKREPQKNGFFPLPPLPENKDKDKDDTCNDSEHNPPMHLNIPHGHGYKHTCPSCGKITIITPPQLTL